MSQNSTEKIRQFVFGIGRQNNEIGSDQSSKPRNETRFETEIEPLLKTETISSDENKRKLKLALIRLYGINDHQFSAILTMLAERDEAAAV